MKLTNRIVYSGGLVAAMCLAGCGEEAPAVWGGPLSQNAAPIPAEVPSASGEAGESVPQSATGALPDGWVPSAPQARSEGAWLAANFNPHTVVPVDDRWADRFPERFPGAIAPDDEPVGDEPAGDEPADDEPDLVGLKDGDLCTFTPFDVAEGCRDGGQVYCVMESRFSDLFPDGFKIGDDVGFELTSAEAFYNATPPQGAMGPLVGRAVDPSATDANPLAVELAVLWLNIELSAHDMFGALPLESVARSGGPFSGWSYRAIAEFAEQVLVDESGSELADMGLDLEQLAEELATLNVAAKGCVPTELIKAP